MTSPETDSTMAAMTDAVMRGRAGDVDGVKVAGFYPSLHLNLADDFRRLGAFDAAREHLAAARAASPELGSDGYGRMIRQAIDEVCGAVDAGDTARRPTAPSPT